MRTPEQRPRRAAALRYDKDDAKGAPTVVAAGRGEIAEKILAAAREAGVPIREDRALAEALAALEVGTEIPPQLYEAVAQALVWALRLDRSSHVPGSDPGTRP
jgi:flagellar biosynthesis protein